MFKIFCRSQPIIPIVYVDANVNQLNAANLLKKLRKTKYNSAQGIAIVCSVSNNMPVQVDKIYQQINRIREQYKIPVYSFLSDECNPQSYYIASSADHVYSLSSTIFNLKHTTNKILWNDLLSQYQMKTITIKSDHTLNGSAFDQFTSPNTANIINSKETHIDQKIYAQAVNNRLTITKKRQNPQIYQDIKNKLPQTVPGVMIGSQAVNAGLIDEIGEHYQILKEKFPECRFQIIKYVDEPKMKWSLLILLLVIKGTIKWSLIMYLWLKSKQNKKKENQNANNAK